MATSEVVVLAPAFEKELADRERPGAFRRTVRPWLNKPLGVIGLAIIAFMAVLSLGAPFLQRYEPTETFQIPNSNYDPNSTEVFQVYLRAKAQADADLRGRDLDWTVVRPGGLTNTPATGRVSLGELIGGGSISREDVAQVLLRVLDSPLTAARQFQVISGSTPIADAVAELVRNH